MTSSVDTRYLLISACWSLVVTGVNLEVIGSSCLIMQTLADFSRYHWIAESVMLAIFLLHLELQYFLVYGNRKEQHSQPIGNKECERHGVKQIFIGQRLLEVASGN
jgi:hypothetical protein